MVEPLRTDPVIRKLLEKTEAGKVDWLPSDEGYQCSPGDNFNFTIRKVEDSYVLTMEDEYHREIFKEIVHEEIFYKNASEEEKVRIFEDLYEMARRMALDADNKISGAYSALDKI
jgi:ASC-1-like (ASCH) protein